MTSTPTTFKRSCFIDYPDRATAIDAIIALGESSPTPFVIVSISDIPEFAPNPISVYFVLDACDVLTEDGERVEREFIAVAGGTYSGS